MCSQDLANINFYLAHNFPSTYLKKQEANTLLDGKSIKLIADFYYLKDPVIMSESLT